VVLYAVWLALVVAWAAWLLRPARSAVLPRQRRRAVPWGGMEALLAFLIFLLWPTAVNDALRATGFFRRVYGSEFGNALVFGDMGPIDVIRVNLWRSDFAMPLSVTSMVVLLWRYSGTRPYQLGLTAHRLGRNVLVGGITAICVVPVVEFVILPAATWLLRGVGQAPEEHPITRLVLSHPLPIDFVAGIFAALVAAPLVEELLFRGIIQPWFRTRRWGEWLGIAGALLLAVGGRWSGLWAGWKAHSWAHVWPELLPAGFVLVMTAVYLPARARLPAAAGAVWVTSLLFAAGHSFALSHPVPLFFFSLALGALRYRTQSLVAPVVTHGLFNAVGWVLLLVPQLSDKPDKGKETTDARARPELVSTSSAVPGSVLPRRTYASATTAPGAGDRADDVTCPASLPSRVNIAPAGGG
jgi:membrane protease YdiL (CAAX protease family)